MSGKPRAALYARFSTDLQADRSVDDQLALCERFCSDQGIEAVARYHDRARSGATLHGRDGLQRLLVDARAARFDLVIVEALDRLSRDQEDLAGIYKRLSFGGIEIIAVHDGKADAIQVGIRGLVSTLFLADLKHKIRRGMDGVVSDGRTAGGRAYGYRPTPGDPGRPIIHEAEADIIRRIFAEYASGRSPREIAGRLNSDSIPPPRGGGTWNASTINGNRARGSGILHNPLYVGEIVWNRVQMVRDPDTGKRISRLNPPSEWRRSDAPHLRIVDESLREAVEARSDGSAPLPRKRADPRAKRLLTGLLRCARCGGGMSMHDKRGDVVRIRCSTARESGSCDNQRRYRLDLIERAVVDSVVEKLRHPDAVAEWLAETQAEQRDGAKLRAKLERAVADAEAKVNRLQVNLIEGRIDPAFFDAQIAPARAELASRRAAIETTAPVHVVTLHPGAMKEMALMLQALAEHLPRIDPREDREMFEAFRSLIDSVTIHDTPEGGVECEITGTLSTLVDRRGLGGKHRDSVVAEDRLHSIPPMIWRIVAA